MTQDGPITPVLLSGGEGSRLWPLSRRSHPKQFVGIGGPLTLFQQAALRFAPGEDGLFAPPVVMTGADFRFMARDQLECAGIAPEAVLIEPVPRNTAPAILAAALLMEARDPGAVLLIAPADHAIPDPAGCRRAVARGLPALATGQIVAFGIAPDRPETGYGYIEAGPLLDNTSDPIAGPRRVLRFVEKPDAARAAEMVQEGRFLWNAGLFLTRAADLVAAFRLHAPHCLGPVSAALAGARDDLGFLRLDPASFAAAPSISVDFAVMEKATNLALVPYVGAWSDLGDWNAIWRGQAQDDAGVACHGPAEAIGCRNSLLRAEAGGQVLVGIGLEDMIAVAMPDAVLVAPRARAQEVRHAVAQLRARSAPQADAAQRDYRPWGWFETLVLGPGFRVKRIMVAPGGRLSLQSHSHRAEHWVVVEGEARITLGTQTQVLGPDRSVYVPIGTVHRLENPGPDPVVLIEVQTGSYLGEDDIVRHDDAYARGPGAGG